MVTILFRYHLLPIQKKPLSYQSWKISHVIKFCLLMQTIWLAKKKKKKEKTKDTNINRVINSGKE